MGNTFDFLPEVLMPWRECSVMEERLRFVARLLDEEGMSEMCREFGISRKTGYKIFNRCKDEGLEALCDRPRRPVRYANQIERLIVETKCKKPHWGVSRGRSRDSHPAVDRDIL
jgi:transposase